MNFRLFTVLATLLVLACGVTLSGGTVYDESVSGDLSNDGLLPTAIGVGLGSNQIFGTTGRGAALDRDYLTFTIPSGMLLSAIMVLPGTQTGGALSFIGLQKGSQLTLPTNPPDATGLLGWWHYSVSDINTDILDDMSVPAFGSTGFTPPLQAGAYALWIQDFNPGAVNYGFDLQVVPTPEASTFGLLLAPLAGFAVVLSRRAGVIRRSRK